MKIFRKLFVIIIFSCVFLSCKTSDKLLRYDSNCIKELENITLVSQKYPYSCNTAAMAIVKTYLGIAVDDDDIRNELDIISREKGMLPKDFLFFSNKVFQPLSYSVLALNPKTENEIINIISNSIIENLPLIIYYSTEDIWNKPNYDTHYAVIYGIDTENQKIKIVNPYGYFEEMTFSELLNGLNYKNYKAEPLAHRMGRFVGIIRKSNMFILRKRENI